VNTHVNVLGTLFIVFGVFYVILALGSSLFMGMIATFVGAQGGDDALIGATVLGLAGTALFVFWLCLGIPGIITGWGLLKRKNWARILGIVLSAVRLIHIPIGTVLGAYGLWVLFSKDTEDLFES